MYSRHVHAINVNPSYLEKLLTVYLLYNILCGFGRLEEIIEKLLPSQIVLKFL